MEPNRSEDTAREVQSRLLLTHAQSQLLASPHSPSPCAPWVTLVWAQDFTPLGTEGAFWEAEKTNGDVGGELQAILAAPPSGTPVLPVPRGLLGVVSAGSRQASAKPAVAAIPAAERLTHRNWGGKEGRLPRA